MVGAAVEMGEWASGRVGEWASGCADARAMPSDVADRPKSPRDGPKSNCLHRGQGRTLTDTARTRARMSAGHERTPTSRNFFADCLGTLRRLLLVKSRVLFLRKKPS